jgi:NAD(P)-dependent dehydrogenase (short-subunit alcohol dehydrogenase family)
VTATPPVVVITGASAGVGRAVARAYGARRARVGLLARGRDGLAGARRDIEAAGGEALVVPTDVADAEQVEAAAQAVEETLGPIDVWVNNAMVSVFAPITATTADEYRRVTEVTYLGYVHGTLAALRRMGPRDRGVIVQVGSALAYRAIPLQSAYCAAKHAVEGFTESLRTELRHDGSRVRVTIVQMPALNTPQFEWSRTRMPRRPQPVPPIYQPEVAARAVLWAADHPDRAELHVGFSTLLAVASSKFFPRVGDWYLARTGYAAQQTDEPASPGRPDNLWEPVRGDHGAHGRFEDRARPRSLHLWLTTHREPLAALGVLGVAAFAMGLLGRGACGRRRR